MMKLFPRFSERSTPWFFGLLTVLAYGLLVFQTGFYWDDWPFAWSAHFLGPTSFFDSFVRVRPFLAPIFWLTTTLLPETPLAWQIFALVIRFLLTLTAWWAFRQIWPAHPRQTLLAALAFLVYPGYSQHWVAFTHINQELIPLLFYLLSFGMTGLALRSASGGNRRTILSLLLLAMGVFPTEYFITLEPLRFFFLASIFYEREESARALWRAVRAWLPYLAVWGLNALWLLFYYRSGIYANYDVTLGETTLSPAGVVTGWLAASGEAVWEAGFYAWGLLPLLAARSFTAPSTWLAVGVAGVSFGLVWVFLRRFSWPEPLAVRSTWALQAIIIGLIGLVLGRIPSWAAGLPLTLQSSFDRFTVSMFPAAALLTAGMLSLLFRRETLWRVAAACVVALGTGQQVYNANIFRRDWERQQSFYRQLVERIPALSPGTVLLTDEVEMDYETDYALTAAVNWIYAPEFRGGNLPYLVLGVGERSGRLPAFEPGHAFTFPYRPVRFEGNTAQAVVFLFPPGGCLRILDPAFDSEATSGKESALLSQLLPLSNPAHIQTDRPAPALPASVFGPEKPTTWCSYYVRAERARQYRDWAQVTRLWQESAAAGFTPSNVLELLPFVEAYAHAGAWQEVEMLSARALESPVGRKALCALWRRLNVELTVPASILQQANCSP
ncbi:MAG: hypothetical protein N2117_04675 [Anaerolineales bacterium]|nr:hypothetical protein [Anaerolineales bacterium]MCX7754523.1 hypothetical protein [Anaerolineales bacterium]MDW8277224.1 hypothetical protein [Anaerolineales bacterium]